MKYKVGDMVRDRKDLVVNNEYNGVIYISSMDELKDEMKRNKEDIKCIEKCIKDKSEIREQCKKFPFNCTGCGIKKFKDKYKDKYDGDMECVDLFRYLKEKGEI